MPIRQYGAEEAEKETGANRWADLERVADASFRKPYRYRSRVALMSPPYRRINFGRPFGPPKIVRPEKLAPLHLFTASRCRCETVGLRNGLAMSRATRATKISVKLQFSDRDVC